MDERTIIDKRYVATPGKFRVITKFNGDNEVGQFGEDSSDAQTIRKRVEQFNKNHAGKATAHVYDDKGACRDAG